MVKSFTHSVQIKFHQADPAGIMYFAHIFSLAHDCLELFVQAAGYSWDEFFRNNKTLAPIRHAECDYFKPLIAGETYNIAVCLTAFSSSSFQMQYCFSKDDVTYATVNLVHTCLDLKTFKKIEIPNKLKEKLAPYLKEVSA